VVQLDVHAVHDGAAARVDDHIFVVLDFDLLAGKLHSQFRLQSVNDVGVWVWPLLNLVLALKDLVVAVLHVVSQFGVHLEHHVPLVGNGGHGLLARDLDDEVGVVVADRRQIPVC
jgi:hypothetical protein